LPDDPATILHSCLLRQRAAWFAIDAEARNYLAFIGERGAHYVLNLALSAAISF